MNLSTTEKIIGKNIDGKNIYECTFTREADVDYVAGRYNEYIFDFGSNIKKVIDAKGFVCRTQGDIIYCSPIMCNSFTRPTDYTVMISNFIVTLPSGMARYSFHVNSYNITHLSIQITLQYTKITD